MADAMALPGGADQLLTGGRGSAKRSTTTRERPRLRTVGKAQTLLTFCSAGGACGMCRDDRASLTRLGY